MRGEEEDGEGKGERDRGFSGRQFLLGLWLVDSEDKPLSSSPALQNLTVSLCATEILHFRVMQNDSVFCPFVLEI